MSTDELLEALLALDQETRAALIDVINENPDDLRAFLVSNDPREQPDQDDPAAGPTTEKPADTETAGDPSRETNDDDADDWTLVGNETADVTDRPEEEDDTADQLTELTPAERALYSVVETINTPRTASEIVDELIPRERPELQEQYSSLGNRGWVSSKLNKFARHGLIGKFRDGREVRYTPDIEVAVRNWAMKNSVLIDELDPDEHVDRIIADTNMNRDAILTVIDNIQSTAHP
jgi:hypothetical protein